MKKIAVFLVSLFTIMTGFAITYTPSNDPDNLISCEFFKKQLGWVDPGKLWSCRSNPDAVKVQDEIFTMISPKKAVRAYIPLNIGYETADRFRLTFDYRIQGNGYVSLNYQVRRRPATTAL